MRATFKCLLQPLFTFLTLLLRALFPWRLILARSRLPCHILRPPNDNNSKNDIAEKSTNLYEGGPLKIVHLSDFHADLVENWPEKVSPRMLEAVVTLTQLEEPDLILLTGDYVDRAARAITQLVPYLRRLRAKYGVFASLGNHDYKESYAARSEIVHVLEEECGIRVLTCAHVSPIPGLSELELVGIGDIVSSADFRPEDTFKHARPPSEESGIFRILLSHNPDSFDSFLPWKVDLQLAGHTHGGQICYPNGTPVLRHLRRLYDALPPCLSFLKPLFPIHVHAIQNWDYVAGYHRAQRKDGGFNALYVSRGLGTHPPCRINCACEMNVLELVPAAAALSPTHTSTLVASAAQPTPLRMIVPTSSQ